MFNQPNYMAQIEIQLQIYNLPCLCTVDATSITTFLVSSINFNLSKVVFQILFRINIAESKITFFFFFRYIWHLYLSMFLKKSDADKAKSLSDKFRIIQAFVTSVPLMLLNVITLINALKVEGHDVLDISYLSQHLNEGKNRTVVKFDILKYI